MKTFKTFNGTSYPVTDGWHATHIAAFPGIDQMDAAQVKGTILGLHRKAESRVEGKRLGTLPLTAEIITDHERALIRACDAVNNFNAMVVALRGRDPRLAYNEEVGLDLLKFTDWTPDTCGCQHQFMWRKDHDGEQRQHHAHAALKRCAAHAHLADHNDHFAELLAENRHSNAAREIVASHLGVTPEDVVKTYNDKRELVLVHSALTPDTQDAIQVELQASPHANTRVTHLAQG